MSNDEPPKNNNFANAEEICSAIESLTEIQLARLKQAGQYALFGTEYTDPLELLGEAVLRAMEGSDGGPGRHWPKHVDFMAFLIKTMQSIADGSRDSVVQNETDHLETMATAGGDSESALARGGHSHADIFEQAVEFEETDERRERAKADADLIDAHFAGDQDVESLIMGEKDGMKAKEIRVMFDMDEKTYDTARRRFRRGLDKLMPGRRKS